MGTRRQINGVLLLDKPTGMTSQTAVTRVKHLLCAAKAGHTGTLDPMASGLLPICLGEATKFAHFLLGADKTYLATVKLGSTTTTGDMEGDVTGTAPVVVDPPMIASVLGRFTGEIWQTPPMYSAIKHAGKPLYKYAREGTEFERKPRLVRVYAIECTGFERDELHLSVRCGKGTYIRVLAEEIGNALGCGGCLSALARTAAGSFRLDAAVSLTTLEEMARARRELLVLPVDSMVTALYRVDLDAPQAHRISAGGTLQGLNAAPCGTMVRLYGPQQEYLGVAMTEDSGTLVPRRLMSMGKGVTHTRTSLASRRD